MNTVVVVIVDIKPEDAQQKVQWALERDGLTREHIIGVGEGVSYEDMTIRFTGKKSTEGNNP